MLNTHKTVTVKDIAARLNVSLSTVNKALTGKGGISEARRHQILDVAREMGYVVNHAAQSLSRGLLKIGIIIPAVWRQYFGTMESGMSMELDSLAQFNVTGLIRYGQTTQDIEQAFNELMDEGVHCIIYCPSNLPLTEGFCEHIRRSGMPIFMAGSEYLGLNSVCTVSVNAQLAGSMSADFLSLLLPKGAKVVAFTGSKDMMAHVEKVRCFALHAAECGLHLVGVYETQDDPDIASACAAKLYREQPDVQGIYIATGIAGPILTCIESYALETRPRIIGTDVYDEVKRAVLSGTIDATIFQNQVLTGRMAIKMAYQYLIESSSYQMERRPISKKVYINPHLLLASNLERFETDNGHDYIME